MPTIKEEGEFSPSASEQIKLAVSQQVSIGRSPESEAINMGATFSTGGANEILRAQARPEIDQVPMNTPPGLIRKAAGETAVNPKSEQATMSQSACHTSDGIKDVDPSNETCAVGGVETKQESSLKSVNPDSSRKRTRRSLESNGGSVSKRAKPVELTNQPVEGTFPKNKQVAVFLPREDSNCIVARIVSYDAEMER